jgi:hypothetical protein
MSVRFREEVHALLWWCDHPLMSRGRPHVWLARRASVRIVSGCAVVCPQSAANANKISNFPQRDFTGLGSYLAATSIPLSFRSCCCWSLLRYFFPNMNIVWFEQSMKTSSFSPFTRTPGHRTRQLYKSPVTSKPSSLISALNRLPTTSLFRYALRKYLVGNRVKTP